MSSWIVAHAHIDALVNAGVQHGLIDPKIGPKGLNEFGRETLWRANVRGVNFNYGERTRVPAYSFRPTEGFLDPSAVVMLAECFGYQSCDRPDYDRSKAAKFIAELIVRCKADPRYSGEYDNWGVPGRASMWGIDDLNDVPTVDAVTEVRA
jgi:hypothetical protein